MRNLLASLAMALVTMLVVSILAYGLLYLLPGDPAIAIAGEGATTEQVERIRGELGLDRPFIEQYWSWLTNAARGDFGTSLTSGDAVSDRIARALPVTVNLVIASLVLSIGIGVPVGVISALHAGSRTEPFLLGATTVGISIPNFWLGMLLIVFVAVPVSWIPTFGYSAPGDGLGPYLSHLLLPALTLSTAGIAEIARQMRAAMIEVLRSDHVRAAKAKGLTRRQIVTHHLLKQSSIPVVTVGGLLMSRLLGGTVVVEAVFNIPGAGSLVAHASATRDVPLIQGLIVALTVLVLATNLVVDQMYARLDPRLRRA